MPIFFLDFYDQFAGRLTRLWSTKYVLATKKKRLINFIGNSSRIVVVVKQSKLYVTLTVLLIAKILH